MKSTSLIFLASLVASSVTFAQDAVPEPVLDLMSRDLSAKTITLTQSVYVYHWATTDKLDPEIADLDQKALKRLNGISKMFWETLNDYGLVGGGVYSAREPLSSSRYGDDWGWGDQSNKGVLMSIRLDPGTKLLDIRTLPQNVPLYNEYSYGGEINLRADTVAALKTVGCEIPARGHIRDHWFRSPTCAKILAATFKRMGIVGNVHSWWSGNLVGCNPHSDTFAIFGENFFNLDKVRTYTRERVTTKGYEKLPNAAEYRAEIDYMTQLALENRNESYQEGTPRTILALLGVSESATPAPTVSLKDYKSLHLFHCDQNTREEIVQIPEWLRDVYPAEAAAADQAIRELTGAPAGAR